MKVSIRDTDALRAVSPAALSAYARAEGWSPQERYRVHSDVYVGEARPEIIVPRTMRLGDYASVVSALIETFAQVSGQDQLTVYRSLVIADRDVVRVRAAESDDGSVTLNQGADLIGGIRDMLLSAACSLRDPRPVYRAGANREAADLLNRVRLGPLLSHKVRRKEGPERTCDGMIEFAQTNQITGGSGPWRTIIPYWRSFSSWCRDMNSRPMRDGITKGASCAR